MTDQPGNRTASSDALREQVLIALRSIYDPEIPVNICDLGLVYGVEVSPEGDVAVRMTLTTPNCPEAESLPGRVRARVGMVPQVREVAVELVWEPPWGPQMMSEAARLELGLD